MPADYDVIVIGSGIGGMTTATALSRMDHKVLVLEQAQTIGGLTHAFSRNGFKWDVGVHYCGLLGPDQPVGRIFNWLSGGAIEFRSVGTVYDTLHFPGDFRVDVGRPAEAYKMELKEHFPDNAGEIDTYFDALLSAEAATRVVAVERAMPKPLRSAHRWWNNKKIQRWVNRTTREVISDIVTDPKLAAVLTAQWGTYGGKPSEASFGMHARVISHYLDGARYPVGSAASIAKVLSAVIESAGGHTMANTPISEILFEEGKAVGVRTSSGKEFNASHIVSAVGAGETIRHLLPPEIRQREWAEEIASFKPSVCHFELFLGFEGDVEQHGATRANHWFYERWDTDNAIWSGTPGSPMQMAFISFPSLKDPDHKPGPLNKHTGEMMVLADWAAVAEFADGGAEAHPERWAAFKQEVETQLRTYFQSKFPSLAPLIAYCELGTPLATTAFTGHDKGAFYGVETTPRRVLSEALNARTPVEGLFLSGQDVVSPGIAGALWGGMFGAAAIDPRVYRKFG